MRTLQALGEQPDEVTAHPPLSCDALASDKLSLDLVAHGPHHQLDELVVGLCVEGAGLDQDPKALTDELTPEAAIEDVLDRYR